MTQLREITLEEANFLSKKYGIPGEELKLTLDPNQVMDRMLETEPLNIDQTIPGEPNPLPQKDKTYIATLNNLARVLGNGSIRGFYSDNVEGVSAIRDGSGTAIVDAEVFSSAFPHVTRKDVENGIQRYHNHQQHSELSGINSATLYTLACDAKRGKTRLYVINR